MQDTTLSLRYAFGRAQGGRDVVAKQFIAAPGPQKYSRPHNDTPHGSPSKRPAAYNCRVLLLLRGGVEGGVATARSIKDRCRLSLSISRAVSSRRGSFAAMAKVIPGDLNGMRI